MSSNAGKDLTQQEEKQAQILLQRRIERYLDLGYGSCFLKDRRIATIVQDSLLKFDCVRYHFSWVVMPNHSHSLLARFEDWELEQLLHSHKSYTAHEANKVLKRCGQFCIEEYFDRYIRNAEHFRNAVSYIENNPVKAGLCAKPGERPFSSAWFRERRDK